MGQIVRRLEPGQLVLGPYMRGWLNRAGVVEGWDVKVDRRRFLLQAELELAATLRAEPPLSPTARLVDLRLGRGVTEKLDRELRPDLGRRAAGALAHAAMAVAGGNRLCGRLVTDVATEATAGEVGGFEHIN